MKKIIHIILITLPITLFLAFPLHAQEPPHFSAETIRTPKDFDGLVQLILNLINPLLGIIVALSLIAFFKGLTSFIAKSGDAKNHADGRNLMVWGLIALFVMVSVFGIIRLFRSDLGLTSRNNPGGLLPLLPEK